MIPHHIIMKRLSMSTVDFRLLEVIMYYFKVGSKTKTGKYISSDIATPQGSILIPILANIVLNELDIFMEKIIVKFEKGNSRKQNPEYLRIKHQVSKLQT